MSVRGQCGSACFIMGQLTKRHENWTLVAFAKTTIIVGTSKHLRSDSGGKGGETRVNAIVNIIIV